MNTDRPVGGAVSLLAIRRCEKWNAGDVLIFHSAPCNIVQCRQKNRKLSLTICERKTWTSSTLGNYSSFRSKCVKMLPYELGYLSPMCKDYYFNITFLKELKWKSYGRSEKKLGVCVLPNAAAEKAKMLYKWCGEKKLLWIFLRQSFLRTHNTIIIPFPKDYMTTMRGGQ